MTFDQKTPLAAFVDFYAGNHEYGLAKTTEDQLRISVRALEKWAEKEVLLEDLTRDLLNGYIDWMRENRARDTIRSRRGNLLTLWSAAFEEGFVQEPPRKIRKAPRDGKRVPQAWTAEEVGQLAEACKKLPGRVALVGVKRSIYFRSFVMATWDTALRMGDLVNKMEYEQVRREPRGRIIVRQSKTQDEIVVRLREETLSAIDECYYQEPLRRYIWPWEQSRRQFFYWFNRAVQIAKIRPGSTKWIRRASVTAVEAQRAGAGQHQAGHRSPEVTRRHYLDATQLADERPMPPALEPGKG